MYIKIKTDDQIHSLAELAHEIWSEHFGPMFSQKHLNHLIEQVQSQEAICKQIQEGTQYFFIQIKDEPIGYFAYKIDSSKKELFLSKIYLLKHARGKGMAKEVILHLETLAKEHGLKQILLTVYNKNELAITAYEKMGFIKQPEILKRNFGNNLLCDDYVMQKNIL